MPVSPNAIWRAAMPRIPRDRSLDSTIALISDPYRFISNRCRRYRSDLLETRLRLRKTICMTGPEAARLFYDPSRFLRRGAMPKAIQKTLLGVDGVRASTTKPTGIASRCSRR